ncbi:hypothetical protein CVT26_000638 [Gymnopilus dilepis]|uniref:DUF5648 domain-containing protein n=1 Tax=Gymnopilus dilepis TaxID=231916 RepID=A0A409WW53_9AGAR|nr:hypothetical protein CVT26_000638 [Gymnopilus dilepis]
MGTLVTVFVFLLCLLRGSVSGSPVLLLGKERSADTCADPSLTGVYVVGFDPNHTWHDYGPRWVFVNNALNGFDWKLQGPAFLAWPNAQELTVPFYELIKQNPDELIFVTSPTGAPPVVDGFTIQGIIGYVYETQVCGSVPLFVAFQEAATDRYYTTSALEHTSLVANGWVDEGIAAFVLPIPADGAWSS